MQLKDLLTPVCNCKWNKRNYHTNTHLACIPYFVRLVIYYTKASFLAWFFTSYASEYLLESK